MPVYFVLRAQVTDPEGYQRYHEAAGSLPPGAKFLAREPDVPMTEGPPSVARTAIVEFPSEAAFREWYEGPVYSKARELRQAASESIGFLVRGAE